MKTLILTLFFVLSASVVVAQPTVAMDFTTADCQGINHNLFTELDEGTVILMEFVMLDPCYSCVLVREYLQPLASAFEASHPGRFKIYTIGWTNSITCTQMEAWMDKHVFANVFFKGNSDMTDYYGGMGMPTVALVAGKDHKVLYISDVNNGFKRADTAIIKDLIAQQLNSSDVKSLIPKDDISLYPNPAHDIIRMSSADFQDIEEVRIINSLGQIVGTRSVSITGDIDVAGLAAGIYSIISTTRDGRERSSTFIKR